MSRFSSFLKTSVGGPLSRIVDVTGFSAHRFVERAPYAVAIIGTRVHAQQDAAASQTFRVLLGTVFRNTRTDQSADRAGDILLTSLTRGARACRAVC